MGEFKFINELATDVQKKLNQWKHQYIINIVTTEIYFIQSAPHLAMLIWREPIKANRNDIQAREESEECMEQRTKDNWNMDMGR